MDPKELNERFVRRLAPPTKEPVTPFHETLWGEVDAEGDRVPPSYHLGKAGADFIKEMLSRPSPISTLFREVTSPVVKGTQVYETLWGPVNEQGDRIDDIVSILQANSVKDMREQDEK